MKTVVNTINSKIICRYMAMIKQVIKQQNISKPIWKPYWYIAYNSSGTAPALITYFVNFTDSHSIILHSSSFSMLPASWVDDRYSNKHCLLTFDRVSEIQLPVLLLAVLLPFLISYLESPFIIFTIFYNKKNLYSSVVKKTSTHVIFSKVLLKNVGVKRSWTD